MGLGVPIALVRPGEFASAELTGKRFLAGVSAYVCGEVLTAAAGKLANVALERSVDFIVAQHLI